MVEGANEDAELEMQTISWSTYAPRVDSRMGSWQRRFSDTDDAEYIVNVETGESSWTLPSDAHLIEDEEDQSQFSMANPSSTEA